MSLSTVAALSRMKGSSVSAPKMIFQRLTIKQTLFLLRHLRDPIVSDAIQFGGVVRGLREGQYATFDELDPEKLYTEIPPDFAAQTQHGPLI
jgi:hypothetical protein